MTLILSQAKNQPMEGNIRTWYAMLGLVGSFSGSGKRCNVIMTARLLQSDRLASKCWFSPFAESDFWLVIEPLSLKVPTDATKGGGVQILRGTILRLI